ncbi:hypothetical protein [Bradyrhizobium cenepequi]|uniref:hypothetical protein n=1 Tax=Bradyrhizobium cenepequi TaxID=2821403 RepID=UPI001CE39DCC|nr:hypothetical protein [Bradyrhizobium cenepequi]MCA6108170.1 hypothetical protein [Bradyrhizobium cenepequi]
MTEKNNRPFFTQEAIRDISEKVYREQLGAEDVRRMIAKDDDGGKKLRNRAASYDQLTRVYLKVFGVEPTEVGG